MLLFVVVVGAAAVVVGGGGVVVGVVVVVVVESLPNAQIQDCSYRGIRSGQSEPAIRDQIARRPNKASQLSEVRHVCV